MVLPRPRATLWLLALTTLAWLVAVFLGFSDSVVTAAGFVPARLEGYEVAHALPVWLTPLSATFVHSGLLHLGFNMLMLGYCGRFAEYALGARGVLVLYGVGAYVAALFQYLWASHALIPMVGASGAISAVVGAYVLLFGQRRRDVAMWQHIARLAAAWIFVQLLVGVATIGSGMSIAIAAHIGGFVAGLLLVSPLISWRERHLRRHGYQDFRER